MTKISCIIQMDVLILHIFQEISQYVLIWILNKHTQVIASVGLGTSIFLGAGPSHAGMNTDASTNSLANVLRVSYSLKLIDKQITTVGDVKQVIYI
jgi:hypothetical protein